MNVVDILQIFSGERLNQDQNRTEHVRTYRVEFDDVTATTSTAATASYGGITIPSVNDLEIATGMRVKTKTVKREEDNPTFFTVEVVLNDSADDKTTGNKGEKFAIDVKITTENYEEPVYLDANNYPICNKAGQPFVNPPIKTYYDERMTISFKSRSVDQTAIDACKGHLNANSIKMTIRGYKRTFAIGTLKMIDSSIGTKVAEGEFLFEISYTFLYRKDGWIRKIFNVGRMDNQSGTLANIHTKHGDLATEDIPLDMDGRAIIDGIVGPAKSIDDPTLIRGQRCYLNFQIDGQASFATLLSGIK